MRGRKASQEISAAKSNHALERLKATCVAEGGEPFLRTCTIKSMAVDNGRQRSEVCGGGQQQSASIGVGRQQSEGGWDHAASMQEITLSPDLSNSNFLEIDRDDSNCFP